MIATISTGRILAIGDIHGCFTTFMTLLEQLRLHKNDNLFITGDMINRGKGTKELIKTLIALSREGYHLFPIRGNHEQTLISTFSLPPEELKARSKKYHTEWLLKKDGSIKPKFSTFFTELPYFYSVESLYFVHGGFDFSLEKPFEEYNSMLYYRGNYDVYSPPQATRIVHGHTPTPLETIIRNVQHNESVIGIDNGCVLKNTENLGNLICLDVRAMKLFVQPNVE
jgi:serine/threonine protein phosphatase 1